MNWHQACELPYYHGSDLGANPTAEGTTFKLWAPTACGVVVCLYATGTDAEPGAKELGVHEMRRGDGGVWAIVLPGNLHGTYYIYRIYFPRHGGGPDTGRPRRLGAGPTPRHPGPRPQRVGGACGGLFR